MVVSLLAVLVGGAAPASASEPVQILEHEGRVPDPSFARQVAVSGDTIIVGYSTHGDPPPADFDHQSLHIYERGADNRFVEVQRISRQNPGFPSPFALDGGWLAIADHAAELPGAVCGQVSLYRLVAGEFTESQVLTPPQCDPDRGFGIRLAIHGDRLAVADRTTLYLYELAGSTWTLLDSTVEPDGDGLAMSDRWLVRSFGESSVQGRGLRIFDVSQPALAGPTEVSIPGVGFACPAVDVEQDRIFVGCPDNEPGHGVVFWFELGQGGWTDRATILPGNGFGTTQFGSSLTLEGDSLLVGAPGWTFSGGPPMLGAAYHFSVANNDLRLTAFYQGVTAGAASTSSLGASVDMEGDLLVIGEPSHARVGRVVLFGVPVGRFSDDDETVHQNGIEAVAAAGITVGCNPPLYTEFCPDRILTRAEAAAFMSRAEDLPPPLTDHFVDDEDHVLEGAINRIADAGITSGCNPPANDRFCPDQPLTRAQFAAFIARALGLPGSVTDHFTDDEDHVLEGAINRIADAGITSGCNPPANDRFCPDELNTRAQAATFMTRAYDLR